MWQAVLFYTVHNLSHGVMYLVDQNHDPSTKHHVWLLVGSNILFIVTHNL